MPVPGSHPSSLSLGCAGATTSSSLAAKVTTTLFDWEQAVLAHTECVLSIECREQCLQTFSTLNSLRCEVVEVVLVLRVGGEGPFSQQRV